MKANVLADSRDIRFVLYELLGIDKITAYKAYSDFDKDMFDDTIDLAEKIAVEYFYPANSEGDRIGAQYNPETAEVTAPEIYRNAIKAFGDAGFVSLSMKTEAGGMGMPFTIYIACSEYFSAGSIALLTYPGMLTTGAANLIVNFGTEEQKKLYLEKMMKGEWTGTMCLTEPDAGTDVGNLKTKAFKQPDGTYLIKGQKIFITAGEHNLATNIIHPVLARIEGDPAGTRGISIFIVPKYLVNPDGSPGKRNDVVCAGIEHKMGLKGSATCTLNFGENGKCAGFLLGSERQGMKIMFQMMNEARTFVGFQGLALSSTAYMHSIVYAKNRVQGVHESRLSDPDAPKVPIIQHPDIKRSLLWMKSYIEGMRMLTYYLSYHIDIEYSLEGNAQKEAKAIIEMLIPIVKAGNTDTSWLVTSEAIQIHGGYGYCSDYQVEQFARDAKIGALYEGTNGIQSIDLAMRKILMNKDHYNYSVWKKRVTDTITEAKGIADEKYIQIVDRGIKKFDEVIEFMKNRLVESRQMYIYKDAAPLQQSMFILALAWLHLRSLIIAIPMMKKLSAGTDGKNKEKILKENTEAAFYTGKVLASQFFISEEFPKFFGKIECILNNESAVIDADEVIFTGAPEE